MGSTTIDTNLTGMQALEEQRAGIKKDGKVTREELNAFNQNAEAMKNSGEITEESFNEAMGWFKTQSDSLAYVKETERIEATDSKKAEIEKLEKQVFQMRNELYKGKYDELTGKKFTKKQRNVLGGVLLSSMASCVPIALKRTNILRYYKHRAVELNEVFYEALKGIPYGAIAAGILYGLTAIGISVYNNKIKPKHAKENMEQYEQQNPELYQALQYAEQKLAELKNS